MEVKKKKEISSYFFPLCGGKIHFMCDFHPNKLGVQLRSFLTATNEIKARAEKGAITGFKKHWIESPSSVLWAKHPVT